VRRMPPRPPPHRYFGGHYDRSPVVLQVPNGGHWFLVIDYGGLAGRGRADVQVLGAAQTASQKAAPSPVGGAVFALVSALSGLGQQSAVPLSRWDAYRGHYLNGRRFVGARPEFLP
jgi:hypothetical protein